LEEFSGAVAEIAEDDDDFLAAGRKRQADDALDFDRGATLATGRAFEPTYLGQTGPIEMSGRSRAGLQVPPLRAARPGPWDAVRAYENGAWRPTDVGVLVGRVDRESGPKWSNRFPAKQEFPIKTSVIGRKTNPFYRLYALTTVMV